VSNWIFYEVQRNLMYLPYLPNKIRMLHIRHLSLLILRKDKVSSKIKCFGHFCQFSKIVCLDPQSRPIKSSSDQIDLLFMVFKHSLCGSLWFHGDFSRFIQLISAWLFVLLLLCFPRHLFRLGFNPSPWQIIYLSGAVQMNLVFSA